MIEKQVMNTKKILVTGATGYVGGRLVPRLLERGYHVRATARSLEKLQGRFWASHPNVELAAVDVSTYSSILDAMQGCQVAYYLVHSMMKEHKNFVDTDRIAAMNFVAAAEVSGLERIIYLGGLGNEKDRLSRHLQSRQEVGEIFRMSSIPTTIFRAAMIIGSGSASFEILRYLVDRLPVMITPSWVRTPCQPIAIVNALEYLIRALEVPETTGQTFDIGGPRVTTYQELMSIYAQVAKLHSRLIIPISVLSPRLSSYWIGFVTPLPPSLGKPLAEGLRNKVVCEDQRIQQLIPQRLLDYREAIEMAVDKLNENTVETSWTDAGLIPRAEWSDESDPQWAGGTLYEECHSILIAASQEKVWKTLLKIGGKQGWYSSSWLWKLRGMIDKMVGGVGLRRGRRDREHLQSGDAVDFWRVKRVNPNENLVFVAEMKLPGEAILEFHLSPFGENETRLDQRACFLPAGLLGLLYWYAVKPLHHLIFPTMLRQIAKESLEN